MKFKTGDEVVLVRNLGKKRGYIDEAYYYGTSIQNVPLNSKGKITDVHGWDYNAVCYVELENGIRTFSAHPDELSYLNSLAEIESDFPQIKQLEKHPIFEIAKQMPVFVINGKIYSTTDTDAKTSLEQIGDFKELEELAYQRNSEIIESIQEQYCEDAEKEMIKKAMYDKNSNLFQLIYTQVFPYTKTKKYNERMEELIEKNISKKMLKNKQNKQNKEPIKQNKNIDKKLHKSLTGKINGLMKKIEKEKYKSTEYKKTNKLYNFNAEKNNFAIIDGNVYELTKKPAKGTEAEVNVEQTKYYLKKLEEKPQFLEEKYLFDVSKKIKKQGLKKHFNKEKITDIINKKDVILPEFNEKEYKEEEFGILKHKGYYDQDYTYYSYIKVPAFALKSQFDDKYYLFKKSRVGMKITNQKDKLYYEHYFTVIDNNEHPFLHRNTQNFSHVCMGGNHFPTTGKDIGDVIAKRLRKAKDALMYGYLTGNRLPGGACDELGTCRSCHTNHYKKHIRSKQWLEKKGIPILEQKDSKKEQK